MPAKRPSKPVEAVESRADGHLDTVALAQRLRDRRTESRLSVRRAAADAGVSFMTLSRVESGSQPDLATFVKLCGWLRVAPEEFFLRGARRDTDTLDAVTRHLVTDPALDRAAAERIASVVRDMYSALARKQSPPPPTVACHLRAASALRPGVPERLGALLGDMRSQLQALASSGEL